MTNRISAQVSLYPLRQPSLAPAIDGAVNLFREAGLEVEPGWMSTLIVGDREVVFTVLKEVFRTIAARGAW